MSKKIEEEKPHVPMWLVLHSIESVVINSETGAMTELPFQKLGFQGMCPLFATKKGAEKYVDGKGYQIVEL